MLTSKGVDWGLIGPREKPRIWDRHIWNCAVIEAAIPNGSRVCDVGSGAGLPGVVLAIARPDLEMTLLEPSARRCLFLSGVVSALGLSNATVVRGRAGEPNGAGPFAVVTARAVAPLARLAGWCAPLVAEGGVLLAIKGAAVRRELAEAAVELRHAGVSDAQIKQYDGGVVTPPTTVVQLRFFSRRRGQEA
jgi:16S rRNA (guanine527-N7)-methyltransferase